MPLPALSIEYHGLRLIALGVEYHPVQARTRNDPLEMDHVTWDVLHLENDPGLRDLTDYLKMPMLDNIEEMLCERFRG